MWTSTEVFVASALATLTGYFIGAAEWRGLYTRLWATCQRVVADRARLMGLISLSFRSEGSIKLKDQATGQWYEISAVPCDDPTEPVEDESEGRA